MKKLILLCLLFALCAPPLFARGYHRHPRYTTFVENHQIRPMTASAVSFGISRHFYVRRGGVNLSFQMTQGAVAPLAPTHYPMVIHHHHYYSPCPHTVTTTTTYW